MRLVLRNHRIGRFVAMILMAFVFIAHRGSGQTGPQPAGKTLRSCRGA